MPSLAKTIKRNVWSLIGRRSADLEIATGVGAYVISNETAKILAELDSRPSHDKPYEMIEADLSDYKKALAEIRELAKKDLKVR
jgi:hypothetical protein